MWLENCGISAKTNAMKYQLLSLLLICCFSVKAQVIQSAQPLELKKSSYYHTSLAAPDAKNSQLVVFAADKEKLTAMRYNGVLFFTDSLSTKRPDTDYDLMAGYGFGADKSVTVYWSNESYTQIQPVTFNFESKAVTSATPLVLSFRQENIITAFSDSDLFYIITLPEQKEEKNKLKFYAFDGGRLTIHTVDFEGVELRSISDKELTINQLLEAYPLQKVDSRTFNGLTNTSSKFKFYINEGAMVMTLDHNAGYTQILTLNLDSFTFTEKRIPQPQLQKAADANSYLHEGRLYQMKANAEQLALSAVDVQSGSVIKSYSATAGDTISFRNSDIVSQTGSGRPKLFKDTKKFLQRLESCAVSLSVYQTPDDILVTAGCVKNVLPVGSAILGATLIIAGGSEQLVSDLYDPESQQINYFEGTFDGDFEHKPFQPGQLAVDYLSRYMVANEKNTALVSVFPFGYDMVLGYYDAKAKQYVLRKFMDEKL